MKKKILKFFSSLVLSIFFFIFSFLIGFTPVFADQVGLKENHDNSLGIIIEESSETRDGSKNTSTPDLGDDQTFPFIPGFGKNSGKD